MAEREDKLIGNGQPDGFKSTSDESRALSNALRTPGMAEALEHEAPINYAESLTQLGVHPEDVERSTIQLVVGGPLKRRQLQAVHASQAAAIRIRNGNGGHH